MVTQAQTLANVRSQIDEQNVTNQYFTDAEIRTWINDGVRDVARRAEVILIFNSSMDAIPNQAKYNLPADVIRVHRVEFVPSGSNQTYPVQLSTYDELDQVWGINQLTTSSYPSVGAAWGTPGNMTIQFYPVPAQAGVFNLFYYGMPPNLATADASDSAKQLTIPAGWDDIIIQYVAWRSMMKGRDPDWQNFKAIYDQTLQQMVDVTRQAHDNGRYIQTQTGFVPQWLYAFSDEG